jgi:hypothetical protein
LLEANSHCKKISIFGGKRVAALAGKITNTLHHFLQWQKPSKGCTAAAFTTFAIFLE